MTLGYKALSPTLQSVQIPATVATAATGVITEQSTTTPPAKPEPVTYRVNAIGQLILAP